MPKILAQLFPNGELRVRVKQRHSVQRFDRAKVIEGPEIQSQGGVRPSSLDYRAEFQEPFLGKCLRLSNSRDGLKSGWGRMPRKTEFGLAGRRMILRSGGIMDSLKGWRAAVTLTLPGSGNDAYRAICAWSGFIANRVKTWLYDQLENPKEIAYFYVWELQKRGALHMHLCINCEKMSVYRKIERGMKDCWISILTDVEYKSGVQMFLSPNGFDHRRRKSNIQVDVQVVKKSVSAYFAKYCGKQGKGLIEHINKGLRPSRWWGCSRFLSRKTRENTVRLMSYEMSEAQVDSVLGCVIDAVGDDVPCYPKFNQYNQSHYIISYPGLGLGREIMEELECRFQRNRSCSLEARLQMERQAMRRIRKIRRRWSSAEERLRLAEVIGTNTREWELFTYLMEYDEGIPEQMIDHILRIIDEEQDMTDEGNELEDFHATDVQLNIGGL